MKLVSVNSSFFELCKFDSELLDNNNRRPYLLIIRLKYKNGNYDFAVPFRSNISENTPKNQYYALPPRPKTKEKHIHGLHYIKMFPITKNYLEKFHIDQDKYYIMLTGVIKSDIKRIVGECQSYLNDYEKGIRPIFSTNIDKIIETIYKRQSNKTNNGNFKDTGTEN